jgi:hypothetical protein
MKLANLRKRGLERDRGGRRKGGEKGEERRRRA